MKRQQLTRNNQQSQNETPLVRGILQRAAVRFSELDDVRSHDDHEAQALINSAFSQDFSQVPMTASKQQQYTVLNPQRHLMPPLQTKLTIGQPGDKYEQEADRVASQVVEQINAPTTSQPTQRQSVQRQEEPEEEIQTKPSISVLQRSPLPTQVQLEAMPEDEELQAKSILQGREAIGGGEASSDVESAINSARGGGQPLEAGLQKSMGQTMGEDFSGVKVHTDAQADKLNQSIQARAFTTGQDVFFRQGAYEPGSRGGQELIAHELSHVVQQRGGYGAPDSMLKIRRFYLENAQNVVSWVDGKADKKKYEISPNSPYQFLWCIPYELYRRRTVTRNDQATKKDASANSENTVRQRQGKGKGEASTQIIKNDEDPTKQWRQVCVKITTTNGASQSQVKRLTIFKTLFPGENSQFYQNIEGVWKDEYDRNAQAVDDTQEKMGELNKGSSQSVVGGSNLNQRTQRYSPTGVDIGRRRIRTVVDEVFNSTVRGMHPHHLMRRNDGRVLTGPNVELDSTVIAGVRTEIERMWRDGQLPTPNNNFTWIVHDGGGPGHAEWYLTLGHQDRGRRISDTIIHINRI